MFFHKFIFILANKTKDINRVYKKKHFFVIFGFLGEKLNLDHVTNTKNQVLHAKFFFVIFIFQHKSKFANKKGIKIFLLQIFVFVYKKKAYHALSIKENFMISIFYREL